jgi:DNA polymerase-1
MSDIKKAIVLDVSNLCHRAYYTTGKLSYEGRDTGVAFGVLKEVEQLQQRHYPDSIIFAYDSRSKRRKDIYPEYKANRKLPSTEEEKEDKARFYAQVDLIPEQFKACGFVNHFKVDGYEADDVMAALVQGPLASCPDVMLVSTDQDLYQLLRPGCTIYSPTKKETLDATQFKFQYGIEPSQWPIVKAVAGCGSDNVKGLDRVGEATVLKYLRGTLRPTTKAYKRIKETIEGVDGLLRRNLELVKLPFDGFPVQDLLPQPDEITEAGLMRLKERLGIRDTRRRDREKRRPKFF